MDIFRSHCLKSGLEHSFNPSIRSPDPSTLFTTSGMQKHRDKFRDRNFSRTTFCDTQRCLRFNDLSEVGDGTHRLDFHMLGLFSFRHWSPNLGVRFWLEFLEPLGVLPDVVTIHPDCQHHRYLYRDLDVRIVEDPGCVWSDGDIGGHCTEFYKDGVEIGNIVVPLGESLDCGFGLERIGSFLPGWTEPPPDRGGSVRDCIELLLEEGFVPGPNKQGYLLRKLIRTGLREGLPLPSHPLVDKERQSRDKTLSGLPRLLSKHPGKPPEFFKDTFGVDPEDLPSDLFG